MKTVLTTTTKGVPCAVESLVQYGSVTMSRQTAAVFARLKNASGFEVVTGETLWSNVGATAIIEITSQGRTWAEAYEAYVADFQNTKDAIERVQAGGSTATAEFSWYARGTMDVLPHWKLEGDYALYNGGRVVSEETLAITLSKLNTLNRSSSVEEVMGTLPFATRELLTEWVTDNVNTHPNGSVVDVDEDNGWGALTLQLERVLVAVMGNTPLTERPKSYVDMKVALELHARVINHKNMEREGIEIEMVKDFVAPGEPIVDYYGQVSFV